jgi:hypothetical protein
MALKDIGLKSINVNFIKNIENKLFSDLLETIRVNQNYDELFYNEFEDKNKIKSILFLIEEVEQHIKIFNSL